MEQGRRAHSGVLARRWSGGNKSVPCWPLCLFPCVGVSVREGRMFDCVFCCVSVYQLCPHSLHIVPDPLGTRNFPCDSPPVHRFLLPQCSVSQWVGVFVLDNLGFFFSAALNLLEPSSCCPSRPILANVRLCHKSAVPCGCE